MSREVRFTATDEEYAEISAYVQAKKRWRKISHFARYCIFKEMDFSRSGAHHATTGKPPGRPLKSKAGAKYEKTGEKLAPQFYGGIGGNVAGAVL